MFLFRRCSQIVKFAAGAMVLSPSAMAEIYYQPLSGMHNQGDATLYGQAFSPLNNPASGSLMLQDNEKFHFSYWNGAGMAFEIGQVDNFIDELDDLVDILDDENISQDDAEKISDRFDDVLVEFGQYGYVKADLHSAVPLLPVAFRLGITPGVWKVNLTTNAQINAGFLDDNLEYVNATSSFETSSSVYLKGAAWAKATLGYSQHLFAVENETWPNGNILVGIDLDFYQMELSKQVIGLTNIKENESVSDVIRDEYDQGQEKSSEVALSAGVIWLGDNYHLGATISNINEPEFEFGDIGVNCQALAGSLRDNCFTAEFFIDQGRISGSETHKMASVLTLDASYQALSWLKLSASYDTSDYNDPTGSEHQWFNMTAHFMPQVRFLPDWYLGYRSNQVGTELDSVVFGLSIMAFNIDAFVSTDSTEVDGSDIPRAAGLKLGFSHQF